MGSLRAPGVGHAGRASAGLRAFMADYGTSPSPSPRIPGTGTLGVAHGDFFAEVQPEVIEGTWLGLKLCST